MCDVERDVRDYFMNVMNLRIIVVGKTKEPYWQAAEAEYIKRLKPYITIENVVLKPGSISASLPIVEIKYHEGENILKRISPDDFVVVLDEQGKDMTSREFAQVSSAWHEARGTICIVIGGAFGLSEDVKQRAQLTLRLSSMTLTHEMARIVLLEQLYRACMINAGRPYHY